MKLFKLLKSLWVYFKPDKKKIIVYAFLVIIGSLVSLLFGYFIGLGVQGLINKKFEIFLIFMGLYFTLDVFHSVVIGYIRTNIYNKIELNFMKKISKELYDKALKMPVKAFDEHKVGEVVNRIYTDPNEVIRILSSLIASLSSIIVGLFIFVVSFTFSYYLALEIVLFVVINTYVNKKYYPKIKKVQEDIRELSDNYVSDANQVLFGIRDVKGLGLKKIMNKNMNKNVDNLYDKQLSSRKIDARYNLFLDFIYIFSEALIYVTLAYSVVQGDIVIATFLAYEWYIWRIFDIARTINNFGSTYQKVIVSLERINDILHNKLYEDEKFGKKNLKKVKGEITFDNVSFGYDDNKNVLDDLSITLSPGQKIAIVGKSGMGKTTLLNLLMRFYEPTAGNIMIDGVNIKDLTEESLREHVAIIRQEPYIFNKTIKENFELIKEGITLEEIRGLCQKVYIDEYIMGLEKGYDTLIGEGGVNLSGGQKQRLSIARSLSKDSKIMLFDESTSALDNESQAYIKKTIDELVKDHTIIIVAHRLSTIVDADVILLMDDGKIIAMGTHLELIKANELYRKLYKPEMLELNI